MYIYIYIYICTHVGSTSQIYTYIFIYPYLLLNSIVPSVYLLSMLPQLIVGFAVVGCLIPLNSCPSLLLIKS